MNREWERAWVGAACPLASARGVLGGTHGMASLREITSGRGQCWLRRRCRDEPANRAEIHGKKLFRVGF